MPEAKGDAPLPEVPEAKGDAPLPEAPTVPEAKGASPLPFRMKAEPPNIKQPPPKRDKKQILDSEGLDKAYQQGDIYGKHNIG